MIKNKIFRIYTRKPIDKAANLNYNIYYVCIFGLSFYGVNFRTMRINLESVRKKESANSIKIGYKIEESKKNEYLSLLKAKEIDDISIEGEISQKNGLVFIDYKIEASFRTDCARCGKETRQYIESCGEGYIADKSEGEDKYGGDDFYVTEIDGVLDLDDFIVEFLGVHVPYRYLCSEGCKGLCQNCGKDLNEGACGCDKKEKNPAFRVLDDFFKE